MVLSMDNLDCNASFCGKSIGVDGVGEEEIVVVDSYDVIHGLVLLNMGCGLWLVGYCSFCAVVKYLSGIVYTPYGKVTVLSKKYFVTM